MTDLASSRWREWDPPFSPGYREACRRRGYWDDRILLEHVADHAGRAPEKVAVVDESGRYTYGGLVEETVAVAKGLARLGVRSGDTVVVCLPAVRQFVPTFLGVERLGAIVVNVMPTLGAHELASILRLAQPTVVVAVAAWGRHRPLSTVDELMGVGPTAPAPALVAVGDLADAESAGTVRSFDDLVREGREDVALLVGPPRGTALANLTFTTGSTGDPKGVLHTHNTSLAAVRSTAQRQLLGDGDVFHAALPVGHTFGYFYGVRMGLLAGGRVVMQSRWNAAEMVRLAEREGITHSAGTPTYLADLVALGDGVVERGLSSMRVFTCAGAPLDPGLARLAMARIPGRISSAYGMSEAGHVASTGPDAAPAKVAGTVGCAHGESTVRIDRAGELVSGIGEVVVAGPSVFPGYLQGRKFTARVVEDEGTYRTGDLGYLDSEGYLVLTGRKTDLVVRGGEKIPAGQIEGLLRRCQGVHDIAVVGVPDARLGQRCVAVVEVTAGSRVGLPQLTDFLQAEGVTRAFWPEEVVECANFPRNEVGKWVRAELAELAAARLGVGQSKKEA